MAEQARALRQALVDAIAEHDADGALSMALDAVRSQHVSIPELYDELAALLVEVGASWQRGETSVWQEHFATSVVRTIIEACHPFVNEAAADTNGKTVLLATPPEEYHDLGLRMLSDRFELSGWKPHLLGASLPVEQLSAAVTALHADAVVLSASTHFHRVALRSYVEQLRVDHPSVTIWVGGSAFAAGAADWAHDILLDPAAIAALGKQAGRKC